MDSHQRLIEASARAKAAEDRRDDHVAASEWHRYRLIRDAARDPEALLAEGVALSAQAIELAASSK
jgi:negative regulator of sigma E activity